MAGRKSFDPQTALEHAMLAFWEQGYAATSVDDLTRVTGLGRGSLYATFENKDALFLRCLDLYSSRYEGRFADALASHSDPVRALAAFFTVTLDRIADPAVPTGCLIAQSSISLPGLSAAAAAKTVTSLHRQYARIHAVLSRSGLPGPEVDALAAHLTATNQSLAVLSRAGFTADQLHQVADISLEALTGHLNRHAPTP